MPPVHVAPANIEGVVLIIQMVLSIVVNHSVGVIVPTAPRGHMKLITVGLIVVVIGERVIGCPDPD